MTKLWENPDPTTSFTAQSITLSSSDYDFILLIFNPSVGLGGYVRNSAIVTKGAHILCTVAGIGNNTVANMSRLLAYTSDTTYTVDTAYLFDGTTTSADNSLCVPVVIYGIKKTINIEFSAIASDVSTDASKCIMPDGVTPASVAITNLYQYGLNYRDVTNDCDTAVNVGFYAINTDAANVPSSEFIHGVLVTLGGFSTYQIAISGTNKIAVRYAVGTTWRII